ncbi:hypothetical protein SCACP_40380 [Sporomusa carbonis]|uniref:DUF3800 domain-containing protein n=1 Tax=Sporomusa carbonis TaxID=3076075 RepID=UPI003A73D692
MESVLYNIYCDESCHLPFDHSNIMVLGAISCPEAKKRNVYEDLRKIKHNHGIDSKVELKWTKVSQSKIALFEDIIEYFFRTKDLCFRAIVVKNKQALDHEKYNSNDYNIWYYKMYYLLLDKFCDPYNKYRIFIDVKDTLGGPRIAKLHEVLCNNKYDFMNDIILNISQIDSSRADLMQLTDLLIGALSFYHRGLYANPSSSISKKRIVQKLVDRYGPALDFGTPLNKKRFNLFIWTPRSGE